MSTWLERCVCIHIYTRKEIDADMSVFITFAFWYDMFHIPTVYFLPGPGFSHFLPPEILGFFFSVRKSLDSVRAAHCHWVGHGF